MFMFLHLGGDPVSHRLTGSCCNQHSLTNHRLSSCLPVRARSFRWSHGLTRKILAGVFLLRYDKEKLRILQKILKRNVEPLVGFVPLMYHLYLWHNKATTACRQMWNMPLKLIPPFCLIFPHFHLYSFWWGVQRTKHSGNSCLERLLLCSHRLGVELLHYLLDKNKIYSSKFQQSSSLPAVRQAGLRRKFWFVFSP